MYAIDRSASFMAAETNHCLLVAINALSEAPCVVVREADIRGLSLGRLIKSIAKRLDIVGVFVRYQVNCAIAVASSIIDAAISGVQFWKRGLDSNPPTHMREVCRQRFEPADEVDQ